MDIKIPSLAEGVESGTVVSILVKPGDQVKKDQTVLEIETKKAVAPIPAPESGTISKIMVKEGQEVSVGQVVISLSTAGATASAKPAPAEKPSAPKIDPAPKPVQDAPPVSNGRGGHEDYQYQSKSGFPPPAAPRIRRMAQELGIDLSRIKGSERGGRITEEDVRAYIQQLQQGAFQKQLVTPSATPQAAAKPAAPSVDFSKWGKVTRKPMSQLRKVISERMTESWTTVARVTQFDEADISTIQELRKKYLPKYEKKGVRLTVTGFLLKAVTNTLKKHPIFNASMDEAAKEIIFKEYINLGIAVDTEQGLIVPVIRDADKKDILTLSKDLADLAERTRSRKVGMQELEGGSFTISNQGGIGGAHFTPIVNKPEVAILGIGQSTEKPVARNGKVVIRPMMPLGLSYDHRVIDGGSAARFIKDLVDAFQNFDEKDVKI